VGEVGVGVSPCEERAEPGKSEEPIEHRGANRRNIDICQPHKEKGKCERNQGPTLLIDILKPFGSLANFRERANRTRGTICRRIADRKNGNQDDDIEDRWQDWDPRILNGDDEWRGFDIDGRGAVQELWIVVRDDETDEEKGDHVKDCNSPEYLFRCPGDSLSGIFAFSGRETNQFGSSKGESCRNKGRTDTLETKRQRPGIMPSRRTEISTLWSPTTINHNTCR
jgi:hypothetical protein